MHDFDTNDDPPRLSGLGSDDSLDLPKLTPRFAPRARALAGGRCFARRAHSQRRMGRPLVAHGRQVARNACVARIALLGTPPRRRRRLWTQCHGRPPGFVS
jgi:hypothetical protein